MSKVAAAGHNHPAMSDSAKESRPNGDATGQPSVFARLQALIPGSALSTNAPSPMSPSAGPAEVHATPTKTRSPPQFLKVRIITWNMHDSLPKGNLEDLLGAVPAYTPRSDLESEKTRIPVFTNEDGGLYHIVVVAGQECPSVSGIPMGLAAGLNKKKDRDRSRDRDREGKSHKTKYRERLRGKDREKGRDKGHTVLDDEPDSPEDASFTSLHASAHTGPSGWSAVLENWYSRRLATVLAKSNSTATDVADDSDSEIRRPRSPTKMGRRMDDKGQTPHALGPYELLVKERMMGIYLSVYIYRDIKHLVRGTSKSAVAAGLIGGRVGNKGGVGISVNLDGITLLFVNAHLAAHEERVLTRLANLAKIKTELNVDDFLGQDDPRVMAEDLTDKFDHMFIFGDLNFRLDITRLHADWLISRQDYAQALAFDQLHHLMRTGKAFVGFHEAPINFPPTFKYDVLRTLKHNKSHRHSQRPKHNHPELSEVQEKDAEARHDAAGGDDGDIQGEVAESASLASTAWTSLHSRQTTEADEDTYDYFKPSSSHGGSVHTAHKQFIANAAHKAKTKWLSLLSSSAPSSPVALSKKRRVPDLDPLIPAAQKSSSLPPALHLSVPTPPILTTASSVELGRSSEQGNDLLRPAFFKRASSSASALLKQEPTGEDKLDKGVYDSSSKQRVPSWCDRILWKSTVEPEPYEEEEEDTPIHGPRPGLRPRVAQFFAQNFLPRSLRGRRASGSSQLSNETPATSEGDCVPLSRPATRRQTIGPWSPWSAGFPNIFNPKFDAGRPTKLYHTRSVEVQPVMPRPPVAPLPQRGLQKGRSFSVTNVVSDPLLLSVRHPAAPDAETLVETDGIPTVRLVGSDRPPPVPPKDPVYKASNGSRWRIFPFLSRDAGPAAGGVEASPAVDSVPAVFRPRRGDVVPLGYSTLDDQAMRRLEGRSDHRPVIGSYAIYI